MISICDVTPHMQQTDANTQVVFCAHILRGAYLPLGRVLTGNIAPHVTRLCTDELLCSVKGCGRGQNVVSLCSCCLRAWFTTRPTHRATRAAKMDWKTCTLIFAPTAPSPHLRLYTSESCHWVLLFWSPQPFSGRRSSLRFEDCFLVVVGVISCVCCDQSFSLEHLEPFRDLRRRVSEQSDAQM